MGRPILYPPGPTLTAQSDRPTPVPRNVCPMRTQFRCRYPGQYDIPILRRGPAVDIKPAIGSDIVSEIQTRHGQLHLAQGIPPGSIWLYGSRIHLPAQTARMPQNKSSIGEEKIENVNSSRASQEHDGADDLARQTTKVNRHGIALVPQPTDDPRDPLVGGRTVSYLNITAFKVADLCLHLPFRTGPPRRKAPLSASCAWLPLQASSKRSPTRPASSSKPNYITRHRWKYPTA